MNGVATDTHIEMACWLVFFNLSIISSAQILFLHATLRAVILKKIPVQFYLFSRFVFVAHNLQEVTRVLLLPLVHTIFNVYARENEPLFTPFCCSLDPLNTTDDGRWTLGGPAVIIERSH